MPRKRHTKSREFDRTLFFLALLLTVLGLIAVADASAPQAVNIFGDKFYFFKQQALWAGIGVIALLVTMKIPVRFWEKIATPLFFVSLALLVVVLLPGVGSKLLGARRWIFIGNFSFQPAELVKLSLAIYLAKVAAAQKRMLAFFVPVIIVTGLIMLQPDLGTALVVSGIALSQLFVSGISLLYFAAVGGAGLAAAFLLVITSEYRRARLFTFLQQTKDPLGESYHIRQILLGLGLGGLFGVGLGQSRQKYLFLPEAATDSIFAIIAEELGFLGASALILLFALLAIRGIKIAAQAPDRFSQALAVGLTAWLAGQAFLNIGSMVALVPLTGIPLPFFSYGGTALVMNLAAAGILLQVSSFSSKEKDGKRRNTIKRK